MAMTLEQRELSNTSLKVSCIGFGASPLGNVFGHVSHGIALAAIHEALHLGINFFDTSPFYRGTISEVVLGNYLKELGVHRDEIIISTKHGCWGQPEWSIIDDDFDKLCGCIDLGFDFKIFDSPATGSCTAALSQRLSETFLALDLYYTVHRSYGISVIRSLISNSSSSIFADDGLPMDNPLFIFSTRDSPEVVKARLK